MECNLFFIIHRHSTIPVLLSVVYLDLIYAAPYRDTQLCTQHKTVPDKMMNGKDRRQSHEGCSWSFGKE